MSPDSIEVTIFGRQYPVVANRETEYIRKLAGIVDQKMKDVANRLPEATSSGVAVLACLNLADELESLKVKQDVRIREIDETVASVIKDIEAKLAVEK
jgi:cell division protein ZapA